METSALEPRPALDQHRCIAFDVETANEIVLAPGEDLAHHGPFDIACGATIDERGEVRHWFKRLDDGSPASCLDAPTARAMLLYLRERQMQGCMVCAWNGVGFDLRWLGHAAEDVPLARQIALDLFDPLLQVFVQRGFPVGLAAAAEGLGITERKTMQAADAPKAWARGEHAAVLEYVAGDCRITQQVVERILGAGQLRWLTHGGRLGKERMPVLRKARDLIDAPEPNTAWMRHPKPRSSLTAWLECSEESMVRET